MRFVQSGEERDYGQKFHSILLESRVSWGLLVDRALLFLENPFDFWLCNLLITVAVKVCQPSSKRETHLTTREINFTLSVSQRNSEPEDELSNWV